MAKRAPDGARDVTILRRLAARIREIAARPDEERKRREWIAHNGLKRGLPRVLCFPEGAWLECIPPETLETTDPLFRGWETRLRMAIYTHEFLGDDQVIDAVFNVPWDVQFSGWGLNVATEIPDPGRRQPYYIHPYLWLSLESHSALGAAHYEAPIKSRADLARLTPQTVRVNEQTSREWIERAHEAFDGLLDVRRRGNPWLVIGGFPVTAAQLRGMENLMLDMYDDPPWVHEFVRFLATSHDTCLTALDQGGYLTPNNGCEWIGTGGIGYTEDLPSTPVSGPVGARDIWGGLQAQDLVGISPAMFGEFFFPHMKPIMERFGLSNYGCCEPEDEWLPLLMQVRNLRRVSISAWAGVRRCAEQIRNRCVFSYKPNPAALSTERMDAAAIRRELVAALAITRACGCVVEIIMKDLHTVRGEPARLRRWVELARAAAAETYG